MRAALHPADCVACADTCRARSSGGAQKAQWRGAKQPVRDADTDGAFLSRRPG